MCVYPNILIGEPFLIGVTVTVMKVADCNVISDDAEVRNFEQSPPVTRFCSYLL